MGWQRQHVQTGASVPHSAMAWVAPSPAGGGVGGGAGGGLRAAGVGGPVAGWAGACGRRSGLELTVFDGAVVDLAATPEMAGRFAAPTGGRFPQARLVTLASCGTRRVRAAALDSSAVSEKALVDQLTDALGPGTLNLADRNFLRHAPVGGGRRHRPAP